MQWINQAELRNWADRIGSREQFPVMIRDLILASVRDVGDIHHMRFPGGEAGQVRGYDGDLTMAVGTPYTPVGRSIWEFGTNDKPAAKFKSDYETRVEDTDAEVRRDLTFVFATPRNWDNANLKLPDFVKEYKDKGDFADVRYIDGAMLDTWLQEHGAVGAKHARLVLGTVPNRGARSTEEFWNEFSSRYRQQLTEEVALAGRTDQAKQIVDHLMSARGPLVFVGDGPDEVSAVAVAAIRKADKTTREFIEARTLIVDTDDAGRLLSKADRYGYILSPTVKEVGESLASFGPTVSTLDYRPTGSGYSRLERPSIREMSEALKSMSYGEEEAETLARKSGRSLTILHRHAHRSGFRPPSWAQGGERLVPALLAGAWSTQQAGDLEIIAQLSGSSYEDYEQTLRSYLPLQDTPIDLRGGFWRLAAPVDAFVNLSHLITRRHLEALGEATIKVFTAEIPPDIAEERFGRSTAPYSSLLREGIATTLLIIAAMHEEVGLEVGLNPEDFVNNLIASIPGLSDDVRVVLGLERQLTYLMEAAPRPLLSALEHLLEGDEAPALLFKETSSYGVARSQIPNLLWALELQAWDPAFFRRSALLLAKLASKDPGGKSGNRPISSLRDLFTAWSPGTNAPMAERIAVIDEIIAEHPQIGWQLVTMLLPKLQDVKGPTQRPRYRDAGASDKEILTYGIVGETYNAMADRALSLVGDDNAHLIEVAEAFPRFSPDRRAQFLAMLAPHAEHTAGEERVELRRALWRLADRHARFRQADWVLPDEELRRLQEIVTSMDTLDPFDQARTLFDDWAPYPVEDITASERAIEQRRANAVANLAATSGAEAVIRLAGAVRFSRGVAFSAAMGIEDESILERILVDGDPQAPAPDLSTAVAGMLRRRRGDGYDAEILSLAERSGWNAVRTASMLLDWPEERRTWDLIATLGREAEQYFWQNRRPFRFEGSAEELEELVHRFVAAGRAGSALSIVHPRERELSWSAITAMLGGRVAEINDGKMDSDIDGYLLGELFKSLRGREDVDPLELAHWEYAFFPVLEYQDGDLALYDRMASDPEFFVSIMKDVFVADDVDPGEEETTPEQRNRGSISHRILIHNERVPGQKNGKIDQAELDAWIDGMNEEAVKQKRTKIVPSYIGRTLAHAAEADGTWPPPEVASAIERLRSDDVEQSIMIERFNMRGVYRKSLFEGGVQERELAAQYRRWAAANVKFPRTKAMLAAVAERWDRDAKRADEDAERDKVRFE
ncbi:hypothetical protein [Sphingomonas lacusdianchii]|uniref:hypothetical protein n=1 Tax=Sphingomonas lacusdianchii TaxID=2917992 RepID=UPI001F5ACBEB|nr:hypothetical protein [Sphingomonas sp. JXJ CY 53]